jgi:histidinol-phosphate aminotransferase
MKNLANPNIFKVAPYVPGKPIEEVRREMGLKSVVKLASNENPYGPSPKVLKAIAAAAKTANRYPDGECFELRQELAKRLKVGLEQFVFGCGSDEVIVLALRAFIRENDEVVIAKPSFLVYSIASAVAGAKVVEVPLCGLKYDLKAMKRAVTERTKIVFIGNPDNPSGQYATKDEVAEFLDGFPDNVFVFFDEAYFDYVGAKDYPDTLALLKSRRNVIVARTFSKLYGLAGLRIGYGIAHPEVADLLNRVREPFNVTSVAQAAALAALKDQAYYKKILAETRRERDVVCRELTKLAGRGVAFSKGATNFIQVSTSRDSSPLAQALLKKGVIVRDMAAWGLQNYIRVSIGTPVENKRFLKALSEVL